MGRGAGRRGKSSERGGRRAGARQLGMFTFGGWWVEEVMSWEGGGEAPLARIKNEKGWQGHHTVSEWEQRTSCRRSWRLSPHRKEPHLRRTGHQWLFSIS